MAPAPSALISKRRQEAETEIARLSAQIGACQTAIETWRAQLVDLDVAERVWLNLEKDSMPSRPIEIETPANRKPAGLPSVSDMIVEALKDANHRGQPGLEPKQMASYIADRWWPDVKITDVGPIAWRMWSKQHTLEKEGATYRLPDNGKLDLTAARAA